MALQPLYKGLGKAEFEGGEVKKNKNHCSLTLPSSPSPLPLPQREGSEMLCLLKTSCTYRGKGNSSCLILSVLFILSAYTFILLNTPTPCLKSLISCLKILAYNLLIYSHYPSSYLLAFHLTSGYLGIHSPPFGGGARGRGYLVE